MPRAYIGLGSNVGGRAEYLRRALAALRAGGQRIAAVSHLYESAPVGPRPQGRFLNAAAAVDTDLGPHALWRRLQAIEFALGRRRGGRGGGPRTIDLDLLLYARLRLRTPALVLPHPRLWARRFALLPLLELGALPPPASRWLAGPALRGQPLRAIAAPAWAAPPDRQR